MNSSKRTTISQLLNLLLETDLCLGFSFLTLWAWVNIGTLMAAFASTFTTTLLTYTCAQALAELLCWKHNYPPSRTPPF